MMNYPSMEYMIIEYTMEYSGSSIIIYHHIPICGWVYYGTWPWNMTVQVGVSNSDLPYLYLLAWLLAVIPSCNHFRGIPASLYSRYPNRILKGTIHFVMAQVNLISSTLHNMYIYIYTHTYAHICTHDILCNMYMYACIYTIYRCTYIRVQIRTDPSLDLNAEDYIPIVTSMLQVQIPLLEWPGDTGRHRETSCRADL